VHGFSQRFQRYNFWDAFLFPGLVPNPGLVLANAFGVFIPRLMKVNQYLNMAVLDTPKH
jgi:hypothetical protein